MALFFKRSPHMKRERTRLPRRAGLNFNLFDRSPPKAAAPAVFPIAAAVPSPPLRLSARTGPASPFRARPPRPTRATAALHRPTDRTHPEPISVRSPHPQRNKSQTQTTCAGGALLPSAAADRHAGARAASPAAGALAQPTVVRPEGGAPGG